MSNAESGGKTISHPPFIVAGFRCAVEMAFVGLLVGLVDLPAENPLFFAVVVLLAFVAMTVVLFWCLNQHIHRWITHAQGKPSYD